MKAELLQILEASPTRAILVVGDLILDRYLFGEVSRISPEAPIQVLEVRGSDEKVGGAANVAQNLTELGARVHLGGVVGDDEEGALLREGVRRTGCLTAAVLADASRPTTVKTRHVAQNQQVLRVDRERRDPIGPALEGLLLEEIRKILADVQLVILSDYAKGVLTPWLLEGTIQQARARRVPVVVDPKGRSYERYAGSTLLTPNRAEAEAETGMRIDTEVELEGAAKCLLERAQSDAIVITLGAGGVYALERSGRTHRIPAEAKAVYDVTGAGDALVAVLGLGLACGAGLEASLRLANLAAGIVVGKLGAVPARREEILAAIHGRDVTSERKILARAAIGAALDPARAKNRTIVFTNGCFDLFHAGHLGYLEFAKSQGDLLVVGVNADASVTRLKGSGRPILALEDRAALLAGLACVDHVVAFEEDTPEALIREVRPQVLVKGEDWKEKGVVGREFVEARGGRVVLAPLVPRRSTSGLVERIQSLAEAKPKRKA